MPSRGNKNSKKNEENPEYAEKRKRNNEAVKKSRDKAKQKADETVKKVRALREGNKKLEGKIEEQRKTKKLLKNLFLEQTTGRSEKPSAEQLAMLKDSDEEEEYPTEDSETQDDSLSSSESDDEPQPPPKRSRVRAH